MFVSPLSPSAPVPRFSPGLVILEDILNTQNGCSDTESQLEVWAELNRTTGRRANQSNYGEGLADNIHEVTFALGRKRLDVI